MNLLLAQNLRNLMGCAGLGETALSKKIDIKQPLIHRILSGENTNPTLHTLQIIAQYFSISISQLVGELPLAVSINKEISTDLNNWYPVPILQSSEQHIMIDHPLSEKAFAIKYLYTNMAPAVPEGAVVVVDPYISPSHKDFILIKEQEQLIIKYCIKKGNDKFLLSSINNFDTIEKCSWEDNVLGTIVRVIYGRKAC